MKKITLPNLSPEKIKLWLQSIDQKVLIQNSIVAGSFLIFLIVFFFPLLIHNQKSKGQVDNFKNKLNQARSKILKIPEMKRQKDLFGARVQKTREQFFESEETDKLIEVASAIAGETSVRISASRPSDEVIELPKPFDARYSSVSYELVVEGTYHNLGMFVNGLEEYSKNFSIRNFQILAATKGATVHQCSLTITAYLKQGTKA